LMMVNGGSAENPARLAVRSLPTFVVEN